MARISTALRNTTAGVNQVESLDDPAAKQAVNNLLALQAQIHLQQARPREAIEIATRVVGLAEHLGPSYALARAYSVLDGGFLDLGQPEKAVNEVKALEIYREIGAARSAAVIESNLGVQAYAEGRWKDATTYYTHSRDELERLGDSTQAAFAGANLGEVLISRGLLDEAKVALEEARDTLRAAEHVTGSIFAETQLARLALIRGDVDSAIDSLTGVVDEAVAVGTASFGLEAAIYLAEAHVRREEAHRALEILDERGANARARVVAARGPPGSGTRPALRQTGDLESASEQLDLALHIARRQLLLYEEAQTLRELADLASAEGRTDEAHEALVEAERLDQRLGAMS